VDGRDRDLTATCPRRGHGQRPSLSVRREDDLVDTSVEAPRTPPGRRGAIDVARVGALVMVVLGHLSLAVIDRGPDGAIRGANVLALHPDLVWLAMLAPMPVFFAAAGWANATATPRSAAPRLRTLVGLAVVVVVSWSTLSMLEYVVFGGGAIADGARIATQPLWFLAVYVPLAAFGSDVARWAEHPVVAVGGSLAVLAALDVARFGYGAPDAIGWPGFFLAWGVPWLIGAWWRRRWQAGWRHERRTGAALVVIGSVCAVGLVLFAGYHPALIDAVEGQRSNTTPPGLFTATAAIVQVGLLMMVATWLDRLAELHRGLFDRGGEASVAVYMWHLSALALCAAVLAAGVWAPERFSGAWWLTRPLWFAAVLGVTALLVAATSWVRGRLGAQIETGPPSDLRIVLGVICVTIGAGTIGLLGPRTPLSATVAVAAFVTGWWCLRAPSARSVL
jgi:hypothetical protein